MKTIILFVFTLFTTSTLVFAIGMREASTQQANSQNGGVSSLHENFPDDSGQSVPPVPEQSVPPIPPVKMYHF